MQVLAPRSYRSASSSTGLKLVCGALHAVVEVDVDVGHPTLGDRELDRHLAGQALPIRQARRLIAGDRPVDVRQGVRLLQRPARPVAVRDRGREGLAVHGQAPIPLPEAELLIDGDRLGVVDVDRIGPLGDEGPGYRERDALLGTCLGLHDRVVEELARVGRVRLVGRPAVPGRGEDRPELASLESLVDVEGAQRGRGDEAARLVVRLAVPFAVARVRIGAGVVGAVTAGRVRILVAVVGARAVAGTVVLVRTLRPRVPTGHRVSTRLEVVLARPAPSHVSGSSHSVSLSSPQDVPTGS